jgi:hypothetical protein
MPFDSPLKTATKVRIPLTRSVCVVTPDRIVIRPSAWAIVRPAIGFLLGAACFVLIMADVTRWSGRLPFALLAVLLCGSLLLIPLSGMGLVYAAIGSNVIADKRKQSISWQQGLIGLGVGTQELVPFWKIDAIEVDEEGAAEQRATEEFAQWELSLRKKSGGRLVIGRVSAARQLEQQSLERATDAARAIAELCGAPLRINAVPESASVAQAGSLAGADQLKQGMTSEQSSLSERITRS